MQKYYPQSQITPNLFTSGGEYVTLRDKRNYTGFYYKTSDGKFFVGKNPSEGYNQTLIPTPELPTRSKSSLNYSVISTLKDQPLLSEASLLNNGESLPYMEFDTTSYQLQFDPSPPNKKIPTSSLPKPTKEDYKIGEFQRYFAKKTNEILYIEISKEQYENFNNKNKEYAYDLYEVAPLTWILGGTTEDFNPRIINQKNAKIIENQRNWYDFSLFVGGGYTKLIQQQPDTFTSTITPPQNNTISSNLGLSTTPTLPNINPSSTPSGGTSGGGGGGY